MKIIILLLFSLACVPVHQDMKLTPEDIKSINEISQKNGGLKQITMRFGEAYKLDFENGSFFTKGSDYCHNGKNQECIKVTNEEINWCTSLCEKNDGLETLDLDYSCENFIYLGEAVGGYCGYHKYTWSCMCKNKVSNFKVKKVEGVHD